MTAVCTTTKDINNSIQFVTFIELKRVVSILLLSVYLISATELRQIAKFPILVYHYFEHVSSDKNLTFIAFLSLHYRVNVIDSDYNKDQKLPFKSHHDCKQIETMLYAHDHLQVFDLKRPHVIFQSKEHLISNDAYFISVYLSSIWQPPKA